MKKNFASQRIGCQALSASDGSAFTGSVTVYVTGDGGTQAAGSVGSGACTHEGNGFHTYAPAQAETNYDHIGFTFIGTGMVPVTVQVYPTFPQTGDNFARTGAPAGASIAADIAAVKTQTAAIETDTQDIQSRLPAALVSGRIDASVGAMASGVVTATAIASDAITDAKVASDVTIAAVTGAVGSVAGNVGGNVTGSVGSVVGLTASNVGSIKAVTDKLDTLVQTASGSPGEYRFTEDALELAPSGGGGGGGGTDWSTGEREQIRHRLGIDGSATAPSATPSLATAAVATIIQSVTDKVNTTLQSAAGSPGEYQFTSDALELAPASSGGGLDAAGVRAALGLASANLDAQLDALPTAVENADALLNRDLATGTDSGSPTVRTVRQALRFLRNKWTIIGTTLTVTKEDDVTTSWTSTVATSAGAEPIVGNDPA